MVRVGFFQVSLSKSGTHAVFFAPIRPCKRNEDCLFTVWATDSNERCFISFRVITKDGMKIAKSRRARLCVPQRHEAHGVLRLIMRI